MINRSNTVTTSGGEFLEVCLVLEARIIGIIHGIVLNGLLVVMLPVAGRKTRKYIY